MSLTADRLRELLHYDSTTGIFTWRVSTSNRASVGTRAGAIGEYRRISLDRRDYAASRLAWLYVKGEWPKGPLDHINMVKTDDRFCNLRLATTSLNNANCQPRGKSGLKGAYRHATRWQSKITVGGRVIYLGAFATAIEAHAAYILAAEEHSANSLDMLLRARKLRLRRQPS